MDKLYIIIPAYNEEMNIESIVKEWHDVISNVGGLGSKLFVIDDGSNDNTYQIICDLKKDFSLLETITKPNSGHGNTILLGYKYALMHNADYIFQTDSDGQTVPTEFYEFWNNRERYSAIIGYRKYRQDGVLRILVTKILKLVLYCTFGFKIADANSPFRLMKREILEKYINRVPEKFNLPNIMLTVLFQYGKESLEFIPITFRPRQGGVNSINFRKILCIGNKAIKDFRKIKKEIMF